MPNPPPTNTTVPTSLAITAAAQPDRRSSMMTTPVIVFVVIALAAVLVLGGGILVWVRFKANQARIRRRDRELEAQTEQGGGWLGPRKEGGTLAGYETAVK